jgi:hypothetical protein
MKKLKRILILVFCFVAATVCYLFGIPAGGAAFLVLGMVFEALFWLGVVGTRRKE